MTNTVNIRELSVEVLLEYERSRGAFLILREVLDQYAYLPKRDRGFLTRLVEGTVENKILLDYIIDQYSKTPVRKQKPFIRVLLRSSVYQMLYMDSVPDSAVCNEAVKYAGKKGFHGLKGFVNGVLRTIARNKDQLKLPGVQENPVEALSVRYSIPEWMVEKWLGTYSVEVTEQSFRYFLEPARLCIHVNEKKCTPKQCRERLEEEGVIVQAHPSIPYAFYIEGIDRLTRLQSFQEGWFWVQDAGSMMVCEAAKITDQTKCVIDVCAAPGGKSLHAATLVADDARIYARDVSEHKIALIDENVSRMGFHNVQTQVMDATQFDADVLETADVVIADVPCSGLGVLGKKPDIKYNISPEQMEELVILQRKIVEQAAKYVKPGGVLVYSTCTVNQQENEEQVQWICSQFGFKPESISDSVGTYFDEATGHATMSRGYLQLLPGFHGCDGFFVAKLRKEKK